jgi:hypothetical protein
MAQLVRRAGVAPAAAALTVLTVLAGLVTPSTAAAATHVNGAYTVILTQIICHDESEAFSDEIRLHHVVETGGSYQIWWRNNVDGGDVFDIGVQVTFDNWARIEVWEQDTSVLFDRLFYLDVSPADANLGERSIYRTGYSYAYTLKYVVVGP